MLDENTELVEEYHKRLVLKYYRGWLEIKYWKETAVSLEDTVGQGRGGIVNMNGTGGKKGITWSKLNVAYLILLSLSQVNIYT